MDLELNYNDDNDCTEQFYDHEADYDARDFDDENDEETASDLFYLCAVPSVHGTLEYVIPLLLLAILFRLSVHFIKSQKLFHAISSISGLYILQHYAPECIYVLPAFIIFSYAFLTMLGKRSTGISIFLPSLLMILLCEYAMTPSTWHKIRGLAMIVVMKIISITIDSTEPDQHIDLYEYCGYVLCPVTCLFGPWIAFKDYSSLQKSSWNKSWILKNAGFFVLAFCFLCSSNCLIPWILSDERFGHLSWLVAYRDALAFRMSHYFVSHMASAVMILGGFPMDISMVTRPLQMEIPRSLVEIVVNWNIPMHHWLKMYIFRPGRKQLGRFGGVLATYLASSLLHGLNFQLSAVLLSLGFYTYVEFQLRLILSDVFDACVGAKACSEQKCTHSRKKRCWWVAVINVTFSVLTVFHLAYLGLMFDTSELQETGYSYEHTISKWSQFNFASHWVAFATYCAYFLIR